MAEINKYANISGLLSSAMDNSLSLYCGQVGLCNESLNCESVHDIRVNIRRFLALLSLVGNLTSSEITGNLKSNLKLQLKSFNPLRDLEVQIAKVRSLVYSFPVLYRFYHSLLSQEELLVYEIKDSIAKFEVGQIVGDAEKIKNTFAKTLYGTSYDYRIMLQLAFLKFNNVKTYFNLAERSDLASIHKVRLAFKKFRYIMENIQDIIKLSAEELSDMKSFQTMLGNIQDNNIFVGKFSEYVKSQEDEPIEKYAPVMEFLMKERENYLEQFYSDFEKIENFWKAEYSE